MTDPDNVSHYRRKRNASLSILDAQKEAHKIAFYPMMFQAIRIMLDKGMLEFIAQNAKTGVTKEDILKEIDLSDYAVGLLLDVGVYGDLLTVKNGWYKPTKIARYILDNPEIRINLNFMHDVCYQGAFFLDESFQNERPEGLKVFGQWKTIYEGLSQLPPKVQDSWFTFDNYYSDLIFDDAVSIILKDKPKIVYDVGTNTGKFSKTLLSADKDVRVRLFDLPPQLEKAKSTLKEVGLSDRAEPYPVDVLSKDLSFPAGADAVFMSQFLDCFAPKEIVSILSALKKAMNPGARLFILEPFVDKQIQTPALSLTNISLYFTCMANGNSRMYKETEMMTYVKDAGLSVTAAHQNLGEFKYTLLECKV